VNAFALSTLLYAAQFAGALPGEHAASLTRWCGALVDAGLGPEDDLRRPPGIPVACMSAHPREGGFGLLPLRHHLLSRWACEAVHVLVGDSGKPWVMVARALLGRLFAGDAQCAAAVWGLALCDRPWLFPAGGAHASLPHPLRALAVGLRALPPLQYVGESPPAPAAWCWYAPLWSNPMLTAQQTWDWFDDQREVSVGLEWMCACGLLRLPRLQTVGEAVWLLSELQRVSALPGGLAARRLAYEREVWHPWLLGRACYADRQLALDHMQQLVAWLPPAWVSAAQAVLREARFGGGSPPVCTVADVASVRGLHAPGLGWRLPSGGVLFLSALTVAAATRLQALDATAALSVRHSACLDRVRLLDGLPPAAGGVPPVREVLGRWWQLKVANTYKEAAWRLMLDAFPTARRMDLNAARCAACPGVCPDVGHHFWLCPVAVAVRRELEQQLTAFGVPPEGGQLSCRHVWLGTLPHPRVHRFVWDLVCLAAVHALETGRRAAWASSQQLEVQVLVEQVAGRAAVAALWSALADFAATAAVPRTARTLALTRQPFLAWSVVVRRGNGLLVVRAG
jgi:hypothetical protein